MWIEELNDGKFKFIERYLDHKTGKYKRVSTIMPTKSSHSWNKATQILNKRIEKKQTSNTEINITLGDLIKEFTAFKKSSWAYITHKNYVNSYKVHIESSDINNYLVTKITVTDIQKFLDSIQYELDRSRGTVSRIKTLIKLSFDYCFNTYGYTVPVDMSRVMLKQNEPKRNMQILDDVPGFLKEVRDNLSDIYADIIEVQLLTGMRTGEVRALTKSDYIVTDDGINKISINKSADLHNRNKIKSTKNYTSNRIIDSSERLDEILKKRIQINDLLFGDRSHYIFSNGNNKMLNYQYIQKQLTELNPNYSTHMLRRTHISMLASNGFTLKYAMDRVGHSNSKTTLEIYTYVSDTERKKEAKKLNNLV